MMLNIIKKLLDKKNIEYFLLSILIILFLFPMKNIKIIMFTVTIIWFIVSFFNDKKYFTSFFIKPNLLSYTIYVWLLFSFISMVVYKILPFSFNYLALPIAMLIYLYYAKKEDKKGIKVIFYVGFYVILIVSIITFIALMFNGSLSRILSTSNKDNYNYFGIAGYSFAYGLIFVLIALISLLVNKKITWKYKSTLLICTFIIACCFYKMSFLIAIIVLIVGIGLLILKPQNIIRDLIIMGLLIVIIVITLQTGLFVKGLDYISKNIDNMYLKSRINDISLILKGEDLEKTDDLKIRFSVYNQSYQTFKHSPYIGLLDNSKNDKYFYPGGHSVILDELARHGLIFSIPLFSSLLICFIYIKKTLSKISTRYWYVIGICALLISCLNTMLFPTLLFLLYTITPAILYMNDTVHLEKGIK